MGVAGRSPEIAVIGCGVFGALVSLELRRRGARVRVFERNDNVFQGASRNNQNRLHLGFHYPRDEQTAIQCVEGFYRFSEEFKDCVSEQFPNAYFIASEGSLTSANDYLRFCDRLGLKYSEIDLKEFEPKINNVDVGVLTEETVYDSRLLGIHIAKRLGEERVDVVLSTEVSSVRRDKERYALYSGPESLGEFQFVVNCTYANHNRFNDVLGIPSKPFQYEYTMVPIIRWRQARCGITVMDGPFVTVLPFGKEEDFLLYHVKHSVIETIVADQLPTHWLDEGTSPSSRLDKRALYDVIVESGSHFLPSLERAELIKFLEGPRMVVANRDDTDERRSIVSCGDNIGFFSVLSGKIDHSIGIAEDVADRIFEKA